MGQPEAPRHRQGPVAGNSVVTRSDAVAGRNGHRGYPRGHTEPVGGPAPAAPGQAAILSDRL